MTDYQMQFIAVIGVLIKRDGISPTYEEIAAAMGVTKNVVASMVRKLVVRGYLVHAKPDRSPCSRWRSVRPADESIAA